MAALQVETFVAALELDTDAADLELETSVTSLKLEATTLELDTEPAALDRRASGDIEAGEVNAEATAAGSISIVVHL
jgi:hypothetical protein